MMDGLKKANIDINRKMLSDNGVVPNVIVTHTRLDKGATAIL
jgi:ribosomal protein L20